MIVLDFLPRVRYPRGRGLKHAFLYEAFSPEAVGLGRRILIGKHSGRAAALSKLRALALPTDEGRATALVARIRELAVSRKRPLNDDELGGLIPVFFT